MMNENPYTAPKSNLEIENKLNRNIAWKIYFFLIVALSVLGIIGLFAIDGSGWPEILSTILIIPATIGFFGYAFSKKILFQKFWTVNFIVQLAWAFLYYFVTKADLAGGMDQESFIASQAIMWVLSVPYYIALFLYSRKNYPLWQEQA